MADTSTAVATAPNPAFAPPDDTDDPAFEQALMEAALAQAAAAQQGMQQSPTAAPGAQAAPPALTQLEQLHRNVRAITDHAGDNPMNTVRDYGSAFAGGLVEGGYSMGDKVAGVSDYLLGTDLSGGPKSGFRQFNEAETRRAADAQGVGGHLAENFGQFTAGLIGIGKFTAAMKVLPWAGRGVTAAQEFIAGSRAATWGAGAAEGAAAGAVAFDPMAERLSNLLVQYPVLNNPVTRYLAAKPEDTAAEGVLKNTLEGLGLSAAMLPVVGAVKLFKALAIGDRAAIQAATEEAVQAQQTTSARPFPEAAPYAPPEFRPAAAPDNANVPQAPLRAANDGAPVEAPAGAALPQEGNLAAKPGEPVGGPPAVTTPRDTPLDPTATAPERPPAPANQDLRQFGAANENAAANTNPPGGLGEQTVRLDARPPAAAANENTARQFLDAAARGDDAGLPAAGASRPVPEAGPPNALSPRTAPASAQSPAAAQSPTTPSIVTPIISDEDLAGLLRSAEDDAKVLQQHGGDRDAAVGSGHRFNAGPGIPWQKFSTPQDVSLFMARATEAMRPGFLDAAKGGAVMSDAAVRGMVERHAATFAQDPAELLGALQSVGAHAVEMAPLMNAGYTMALVGYEDARALAQRIRAGMLDEFHGDMALASAELKRRLAISTAMYAQAESIKSNAGRALRQMRSEFRITPADAKAWQSLDGDVLAELLVNTRGNPAVIAQMAKPSFLARARDFITFLIANNLQWGWRGQTRNLLAGGYMLPLRPAERIIGSFRVGNQGASIRTAALRQYRYMLTSLPDAFFAAKEAFMLGDSRLIPHTVDPNRVTDRLMAPLSPFVPMDGPEAFLRNSLSASLGAGKTGIGLPSRLNTTVDEFIKTIAYRSYFLSQASLEADALRLVGADRRAFLDRAMADAVSKEGRGLDPAALREAQIVTFSQDLLPGTLGKSTQRFLSEHPSGRWMLPFLKTPVNSFRYGVKMTPLLNQTQGEYRQMIRGELGPEAQAQAYGQLAMGSLTLGVVALAAAEGYVTGGGPKDPKLRAELMATGWQPYAIRWRDADGRTHYHSLAGSLDPVAMPFGIAADIMDAIQHPDQFDSAQAAMTALFLAITKQVENKAQLADIAQFFTAVTDPDRSSAFVDGLVTNLVPASSLWRQVRDMGTDGLMRDARSLTDKLIAQVPGLSDTVPPRRDAFGDPITVRNGFGSDDGNDFVNQEIARLITETGSDASQGLAPPVSSMNDTDLRDITMADGANAYDRYQDLAGHPAGRPSLRQRVAQVMQGKAYEVAPDGPSDVRGTKLWMLHEVIRPYREVALDIVRRDPNVRAALSASELRARAARLAKQRDPEGAIPQTKALNEILAGAGLPGVTPPTAAP